MNRIAKVVSLVALTLTSSCIGVEQTAPPPAPDASTAAPAPDASVATVPDAGEAVAADAGVPDASLPVDAGLADLPVPDVSAAPAPDAGPVAGPDAGMASAPDAIAAGPDLGPQPECQWGGAPGQCLGASDCGGLGDHSLMGTSACGGQGCCIVTPNLSDNPPFPPGYRLMMQSEVTSDMTDWAVAILHDPATYPMYATTTRTFGTLLVLAQVEWHPPDFNNGAIHRGVTLFTPQ
jgi:hypothetical protein